MEEGDDFDGEQAILDTHEEKTRNMLDCMYVLLNPIEPTKGFIDDPHHHINRCLVHVDNSMTRISGGVYTTIFLMKTG